LHYSLASCRPPSSSREDLKKVTDDRINLYTKAETTDTLPILVAPFDISDEVPEDCEIAEAVKTLRNGKAPGPSKVRAEKLKEWLNEAIREENPHSENWDRLTELVKLCFLRNGVFLHSYLGRQWFLHRRAVAITGGLASWK